MWFEVNEKFEGNKAVHVLRFVVFENMEKRQARDWRHGILRAFSSGSWLGEFDQQLVWASC
jgi:hypothetical protein